MKNKVINYSFQSIDKKDQNKVLGALSSGILTQGQEILKFENELKKYFNSKFATTVSSGTAALHLAGKALDWNKKDIIVTTPITFIASANAILYNEAKPSFVDINLKDYQIDLNKLETKLKKFKKKIKAVIAVDYAGNPCDWKNLRYLADKFSFKLINDNCHALGAKYYNKKDYAVKFADIVTQSFHPLKNITTGEGGAIITNDYEINKKVNKLRNHGIEDSIKKNYWDKEVKHLGFNYRLTEFQAALGTNQLKKVDGLLKKKQLIAKQYNQFFQNYQNVSIPPVRKNCYHAYHLYPLFLNFKKLKIDKKKFMNFFLKKNYRFQVHYKPIHTFSLYKKKFKFKNNDFPNSMSFFENEVSIPIFPDLKKKTQQELLVLFKKFL